MLPPLTSKALNAMIIHTQTGHSRESSVSRRSTSANGDSTTDRPFDCVRGFRCGCGLTTPKSKPSRDLWLRRGSSSSSLPEVIEASTDGRRRAMELK